MMDFSEHNNSHREVERYFCSVAHELKSPLQEILLYAKVINEDSGERLLPQSRRDLQSIEKICSNALDMVQLFIQQAQVYESVVKWEVLSMKKIVQECVDTMATLLKDRKLTITIDDLPNIIGDHILFQLMISNILSNAVKFTNEIKDAEIRVYAQRDEETTAFVFQDNGIGFNIKYAGKIFNLFERIHTDENIEGNGIGLSLVKSVAERFDGNVEIYAEENKGCKVTIRLPNSLVIPADKKRNEQIVIGVIGAYTGAYSEIAPCRKMAYELAAEEINASGGINGKHIVLKYRDFESDLSKVPRLVWELAAVEKADVIMGGQLSSARELIRDVVDKLKIPYFFNALYEGGLADHYTFCVSSTPEQNIYPMLEYLFMRYGKRCYIIAADYNYGVLTTERVKDYIERRGGTVTGIEYFSAQKDEFQQTIRQIEQARPDILISFCVSRAQSRFYEQWYQSRIFDIPMVSTIGVGLSHLHLTTDAPTMANTYFMSSYIEELDTPSAKLFTDKLRKKYTQQDVPYIEFDAESAYTAVYLYKKAVETAKSAETEDIIAALETGRISFDGPGGNVRIRGEDHQTVREERLFRVNYRHEIEQLALYPSMESDFVEQAILREFGKTGGLKEMGSKSPNTQYNIMFNRIISE